MNTWTFSSRCGWHRLALGSAALFLGMAWGAVGAEPGNDTTYVARFEQARGLVGEGRVPEGEALMREAVSQAEEAQDWASVYWHAWLLAQHRAENWDGAQRLAWFEVAERALNRRDRNHFKWAIADLPNYIELLCEKETVLSSLGRRGEAFAAHRKAADLARESWGAMEREADLRNASPRRIGIFLNLLLDQADHQEMTGRMGACEETFQRCLALTEGYLKGRPDHPVYLGRIANNYAVMLGLTGRDDDEEKYQAEALKHRGHGGELIAEANQLRRDSQNNGPSAELYRQFLKKADQLMAAGRRDAALEVRRRAASVLYDLGRNEEAEELFGQVIAETRRRNYGVVAAHTLYWRAKARGRADPAGAEEDFLSALESYRQQGAKPYECRLYQAYAEFLKKEGRTADALAMVNESLRMNRGMHLVHLRPELLALKAEILEQAGQRSAADEVWEETLGLLREIAGYSENRRLKVQVAHLRHLARCGRQEELAKALAEARAFVEQAQLTDYQTQAFREFKPEEFRVAAEPAAPVSLPTTLQPVYTSTHAQPGQAAQSWFWLLNPSAAGRKGRLRVRGPGTFTWKTEDPARVEIEIQGGAAESVSERDLTLPAEDVLAIRLVHARPPADACRIALEWDGDDDSKAEWNLAGDADRYRAESTFHQHFAQQNAFFSVALYHEIGGTGEGGGLNFRVRGSTACRVEVYDAESLALLAVDADADGSFGGVGDLLARDEDADGYPDADRSPWPVVLHVFPVSGERYEEPLDLTLEIRSGDGWAPMGSDRLIDMAFVAGTSPDEESASATGP